MPGTLNVGGHDIITHSGDAGAGDVTVNVQNRLVLNSSGRVGIGTSSPSALVHTTGSGIGFKHTNGSITLQLYSDSTNVAVIGDGPLFLGTNNANPVLFKINDTVRMQIDSSGHLLVGKTSFPGYGTISSYTNTNDSAGRFFGGPSMSDSASALLVDKYSTTNSTNQWFVGFTINNMTVASGVITANGASQAAFGTWSDRRLKENIVDLPPQLNKILALRPVEFDYVESEGGGHQISFIAQEFEEVYPDAIGERSDGMKTLAGWDKTTARLVKAIQEQQTIIESKQSQIDALTARIEALENA
jgi:hypothetical protein